MSRGTMSRRRGPLAPEPAEECPVGLHLAEEADRRADRVDAENAALRDRVEEVEGWYRLLVSEHDSLRRRHEQVGRKAAEIRAEGPGRPAGGATSRRKFNMNRIHRYWQAARGHGWGAAAAVALATLLARDPGVQGAFSAALAKAGDLAGRGGDRDGAGDASGYVRYAAMIQARDEAERARADYNDREPALKGDALLEAQDRLRAAKARDRQARLAFLPELARRCERARLPVPREATEALASLRRESAE